MKTMANIEGFLINIPSSKEQKIEERDKWLANAKILLGSEFNIEDLNSVRILNENKTKASYTFHVRSNYDSSLSKSNEDIFIGYSYTTAKIFGDKRIIIINDDKNKENRVIFETEDSNPKVYANLKFNHPINLKVVEDYIEVEDSTGKLDYTIALSKEGIFVKKDREFYRIEEALPTNCYGIVANIDQDKVAERRTFSQVFPDLPQKSKVNPEETKVKDKKVINKSVYPFVNIDDEGFGGYNHKTGEIYRRRDSQK